MRLPEKYWPRVQRGLSCWVWQGATKAGYGIVGVRQNGRNRHYKVHRLALLGFEDYEAAGMACHTCANRLCCNPAHLYLGDAKSNFRDMQERGETSSAFLLEQGRPIPPAPGERNAAAKLTWVQVDTLRKLYATGQVTQYQLADIYGMHQTTVSDIVNLKTWKE